MAKDSRFFTVRLPNSDMSKIYKVIVGLPSQQKELPNNKILIKLHHGDELDHPCLNAATPVTHEEAMLLCSEEI